jgi:hypothetical protein
MGDPRSLWLLRNARYPVRLWRRNPRNLTQGKCVHSCGDRGVATFGGDVPSKVRDADYWLDCAEEAQLQAEEMTHPPAKREMLLVAAKYRRLAQHAEERTARKKQGCN